MKCIKTKFQATKNISTSSSNNNSQLFISVMNKRVPHPFCEGVLCACVYVLVCVFVCVVYSCAWAFKQRISSNSMVCILCSQNYQLSHMHDFSIEKCQSVDLPLLFMYENIF